MLLSGPRESHLCYCSNIHPGESLEELRAALEGPVARVKSQVCPDGRFGIGLRISHAAALQLCQPGATAELKSLLDRLGMYVFTLNGFPYGTFHGSTVKERVYLPDWTTEDRGRYTTRLFEILRALIAPGAVGSVSTVPGCFKLHSSPASRRTIARNLSEQALLLWRMERDFGARMILALEPEPNCLLETSADVVRFFQGDLWDGEILQGVAKSTGLSAEMSAELLRRHLGVCVDACHVAVEFEDARSCVESLVKAGIEIAKLQISCGLRAQAGDIANLTRLTHFEDAVYLHQTRVNQGGVIRSYLDLPAALAQEGPSDAEWRVHYHVPIFLEKLGGLTSTQASLKEFLALQRSHPFTSHLEVETYTWDVLPKRYRSVPVHEAIARELTWVLHELRQD